MNRSLSHVGAFDFSKTTSPTPASDPVKIIAAIAKEKESPVYDLDGSQGFVKAPL